MATNRRDDDRTAASRPRDVTAEVEKLRKEKAALPTDDRDGDGLSGETVGEEVLDRSGPSSIGSSGALGALGSPGRDQHR